MFLASTGAGDAGYELQILDSYENKTYVNGQAGSIYKQGIPLVNASRKPGEWQAYDVDLDGADVQRRRLGQDAGLRDGVPQRRAGAEQLRAEGRDALHRQAGLQEVRHGAPIKLQAHGDPSPPISFRNIWIRESVAGLRPGEGLRPAAVARAPKLAQRAPFRVLKGYSSRERTPLCRQGTPAAARRKEGCRQVGRLATRRIDVNRLERRSTRWA